MCNRLNCRFVHSNEGAPEGGFPPPPTGGIAGICFDWQKGMCNRVNCRFAHGGPGGPGGMNGDPMGMGGPGPNGFPNNNGMGPMGGQMGGFNPNFMQGGPQGGGGRGVCYDWQKGMCNRVNCRFAHGDGGDMGGGGGGGNQGGLKPGDWMCPGCNFHNFASRVQCFKCYAPVPMDAPMGFNGGFQNGFGGYNGYNGFGGAPPPNIRPGDWSCPACQMNNFASRTECFKCNTPKDPNQPTAGGPGFEGANGFDQQGNVREGDWCCPNCQINNFASRVQCFKCSTPKQGISA
jgi:hypothetical protein